MTAYITLRMRLATASEAYASIKNYAEKTRKYIADTPDCDLNYWYARLAVLEQRAQEFEAAYDAGELDCEETAA